MNPPNVHAIVLRETPERTDRLKTHLDAEGIPWTRFLGVNAFTWGLTTVHTYEVDHPGSGYIVDRKHVGLALSHHFLWRKLSESSEDVFTVIEDDAIFISGWRLGLEAALRDVPTDWDILMIGSCNCGGQRTQHKKGNVYEVTFPQCTHAMIIRKKALPVMIETQEKAWAPIDLSLIFRTYPLLRVYTVLPRLVDQHNTNINP